MCAKLLQSCLTRCDPMDCSRPGSSVHEILQAGVRGWFPCPLPVDLPTPGIEPDLLCLTHWQAVSLPLLPPGNPKTYSDHSELKSENTENHVKSRDANRII